MSKLGVIWAILGVSALLLTSIVRLAQVSLEAFQYELSVLQWIVLVVFAIFMMQAEGYRGFQKKFSPRTAARVRYIRDYPTALRVLLAPLFAMGFFDANKRTKLVAYILTTGIILLVLLVRNCPQPWRGIIDVGVVLGLSWGLISLWIFIFKALTQADFAHSPEMPDTKKEQS